VTDLSVGTFLIEDAHASDAVASRFQAVLRRRVRRYFEMSGQSPRGGRALWGKSGVLLTSWCVSWGLLLFWASTPVTAALLSVALGLSMAGIGFNIQHDAAHGASSSDRRVNRLLAASLDLLGGSSYLWRFKHNVLHHSQPNTVGVDDDIDLGPLARLAPGQRVRFAHRFQHVYLWFLYSLVAFKWQWFDDYAMLLLGRVGALRVRRPRGAELIIFAGGKVFFLVWSVVLPVLIHPPLTVAVFHGLTVLTLGLSLSLVFQVAHCVPAAWSDAPVVGRAWAIHQVEASVDFSRGNHLLSWCIGGLNFQVEHHLFPGVCHLHYAALAPLVEATCVEFGVRYTTLPTLMAGLRAHYSWLKRMGRREHDAGHPISQGGPILSSGSQGRALQRCDRAS